VCGIVGVFTPNEKNLFKQDVLRMMNMIRYRGPDDSGIYTDNHITIGHVRLSIQDLSKLAAQPMLSHNKNLILAYNGEIYNVKELQNELLTKGIILKSTGDTEALLEYIVNFGIEKTLDKIEGMFAFVLWDKSKKVLIAARDRHGIKPLYYRQRSNGRIDFASELKVLAYPEYEPDLCTLNANLMGVGATWGDPTVFKHVKHVCAGEWLLFNIKGEIQRNKFFKIEDFINNSLFENNSKLSKSKIIDYAHDELKYSTESQLLSDAPVATFVSGGVDSSLIASIAKTKYPNLKLYHCNVNSESETKAAIQLANELKLELIVVSASDREILNNTAITTYHYEAPLHYHNGSCVPFYLLSKKAGQDGIKVILTGEGSDEYFLGYPNIAIRPYIQQIKKISTRLQKLFHTIPRMNEFLWQKIELLPSEQLRSLMFRYELQDRIDEASKRLNYNNSTEKDLRLLCIDMVIGNVSTLLQRNDRLGMAGGLESRFPFLGENVAEMAINLPSKYKIRKTLKFNDVRHAFHSDKWIVRELANIYLPFSLAYRRKFGFQSSVYRRLSVSPEFYKHGFIQEYYGMNDKAICQLLNTAPLRWRENIFSLEVWGQVFSMNKPFDQIQDYIDKYTAINTQ